MKFTLNTDILNSTKHLSNDEAGILFKTIIAFVNGDKAKKVERTILIAFEPVKIFLEKEKEKQSKIRKVRSAAGIISGKKRAKTPPPGLKKIKEDVIDNEEVYKIEVNDLIFNIKTKAFDRKVFETFDKCKVHFELNHLPNSPVRVMNWLGAIDKLHRLDKVDYEEIISISKWGRNHSFWSTNFFTILKLRKLDKEGVKFLDRFRAEMKPKRKNDKRESSEKNNAKTGEDVSDWFVKKLS